MDIGGYIKRRVNLPVNHHFFLFGARQTGKTTLIRSRFGDGRCKEYNLLAADEYTRLVAQPSLLREEVRALNAETTFIFIDEIQRIPDLLNEVQLLIDDKVPQHFILSGSSARKLKRGGGNLLGGRAWRYELFPLTMDEMGQAWDLGQALSFGTLPANVVAKDVFEKRENLRTYGQVYLREEIEAEALSRNIGGFVRFLSIAAQTNAEQLNYSNVARDVALNSVTVKEYFKILEDTLLGFFLLPFRRSQRKRHKLSPKFYFFDTGVLRALQGRLSMPVQPATFEYGQYFETWLINEVNRINSYARKDLALSFLRTASDVEVDLVIETPSGEVYGVEIKSKKHPITLDFEPGFNALKRLVPKARCLCVCTGSQPRRVSGYDVLPYRDFLQLVSAL